MLRKPTRRSRWAAPLATLFALAGTLLPQATQPALAASGNPEATDEIVYIDGEEGFIRVIDSVFGNGAPEVKWISPESNFRDFALADVNADGDKEVIGIKGDPGSGKLVIYDPVASGKTEPGQEINGIPWVTLFTLNTGNRPTLIITGNFDPGVPGDEFLVGVEVESDAGGDSAKKFKMDVYHGTDQTPDGTQWSTYIANRYTEERWTRGDAGDFVSGASDEIALVDEEGGKIEIYRMDGGWKRLFSEGDSQKRAQDAVFGDFDGSDGEQLAWTRSVANDPGGAPTLYVLDWSSNDIEEDVAEAYDPGFRRLAFADGNGSGDQELYMLRNVPDGVDKPRLVSLNDGGDGNHEWEEKLEDNNWRAIAAGNVDTDDREELLIGRQEMIRVYTRPENGPNDRVDYTVSFNRRSLRTGNLDAKGFTAGPVFEASTQNVEATAPFGLTSQAFFTLRNSTTQAAINFSISVEGNPNWLSVVPAGGVVPINNQPTTITLNFNAAGLAQGVYTARLLIDSPDAVENKPYPVEVKFTVTPAVLQTMPGAIFFTNVCSGTTPVSETVTVQVTGSPGTRYSGALAETPGAAEAAAVAAAAASSSVIASPLDWLTATAATNVVTDTITMVISRTTAVTETEFLQLVLLGDASTGTPPNNVRLTPVVICPAAINFMPQVFR